MPLASGGANPGRESHSRVLSTDPDAFVKHRLVACVRIGASLYTAFPAQVVSLCERVELLEVAPIVTQHVRLAVRRPSCVEWESWSVAPVPQAAGGSPFGSRLHAVATYLKTFQALFYGQLQAALSGLFGLTLSQGGLTSCVQGCFRSDRDAAIANLRRAEVVACAETGVHSEGSDAYRWLICLIPGFNGALFTLEWRDALWARFVTAAPQRRRRSVERSSIVKRA